MSKKTRSQLSNAQSGASRITLVTIAAVTLVAAAAAVTLFYGSMDDASSQDTDAARRAALVSEHAPTLGDAGAKVHIVEFLDPACGTCALFYPMVKQWMAEVPGEIRLSIRHVAFHEGVDHAVRALEASRNQDKYWQTLETLLATQSQWVHNHVVQPDKIGPIIANLGLDMEQLKADMNSIEVLRRMEIDKQDAITLKVSATPEYFVNGRSLPSFGQQQLANLVREELD